MKKAASFVLLNTAISCFLFWLCRPLDDQLSTGIMSYVLWFYIINAVLCLLLFPPFVLLLNRLQLHQALKSVLSFLWILVIWNILPWLNDGTILTEETFHPFFSHGNNKVEWMFVMIHLTLLVGFVLTSVFTWLTDKRRKAAEPEDELVP
ncbi:hypothetical protein [Pseudobacter ginsenosidimutans]|jgi:hypothetical protein|uniref:Uncharacterized protein n=1 Tax=Pseudobacter ginsenosidimutans TaxID=661488 RepID=A0A4Q7MKU0_9BACT|nr:hypothetical protein [Pseudobacter ginsenosidimutans]QEC40374.1 hypothetical protein FSB84_01195 [Pseudobacter ginsenosidimutans]RZS69021.1 hypothetical protein EV199_4845 [Pseudobacter ginsenosidimutans]